MNTLSVVPKRNERVEIVADQDSGEPVLLVQLDRGVHCSLQLNLVRYEFLMRVAAGALPGSFSRECHEDILAFKSAVLAALEQVRVPTSGDELVFKLLTLNAAGEPTDEVIEIQLV